MDFIIDEAEVKEDFYSGDFSENESKQSADDFLASDIEEETENDASFYRSFDNREEFHQFKNQIKNPVDETKRSEGEFYGEDDLPEIFLPKEREHVEFHSFQKDKEKTSDFKKTLRCFSDDSVQNHFFYSVIYGIMYQKSTKTPELEFEAEVVGRDFFLKLKEIEPDTLLDHTIFVFLDRCVKMNDVLAEFGHFLRFYERRNKFRYQLRQKLKSKNEMRE